MTDVPDVTDDHRADVAHLVDDYCTLRAKILRGVDGDVDLLTNALHALRHDRTAVTVDHVERVLDHLTRLRDDVRASQPSITRATRTTAG